MSDEGVIRFALTQLVNGERSPADLLGIGPKIVNGLYAMGLDAQAHGRRFTADGIFLRCLMLDPFRADFWIALGASRQALGRPSEAGEIYQIAGLMTPDAAPVAYAAACFAQAGQTERARVLAQFVRDRVPDTTRLDPWLCVAEATTVTSPEAQP